MVSNYDYLSFLPLNGSSWKNHKVTFEIVQLPSGVTYFSEYSATYGILHIRIFGDKGR